MQSKSILLDADFAETKADLCKVAEYARKVVSVETRKKVSLALVEAVLVGLYVNLAKLSGKSESELANAYLELKSKPSFAESARYAVSSVENVKTRLAVAIDSFG